MGEGLVGPHSSQWALLHAPGHKAESFLTSRNRDQIRIAFDIQHVLLDLLGTIVFRIEGMEAAQP